MNRPEDGFGDVHSQLRGCATFSGYSEAQLRRVFHLSSRRPVARGEALARQGGPCEALFVLLLGNAKLLRRAANGRSHVISLMAPGASYGESALFCREGYPLEMVALEPGEVLIVPAAAFLALLRQNPALARGMLAALGRSVHRALAQIEQLTMQSASQRVASFLLEQLRCEGARAAEAGRPAFSRTEIANLLCIRPETLSRTIRDFRRERWVRVENKNIVVLDPESLSRLVGSAPLEHVMAGTGQR